MKPLAENRSPLALLLTAIAVVCSVGAIAMLTIFPLQDYDTFWHLAYGQAMIDAGQFINHEIFSYTAPGKPLGSHSQLAQVLMALVFSAFGANGLILFKSLVLLAVAALAFKVVRRSGLPASWAAGLSLFVMLASQSRFTARPQMFSYLCLILLALWLTDYCRGRGPRWILWLLPFLMVVWDYLHGSVYGVVLLGAVVAGEGGKVLLAGRLPAFLQGAPLLKERSKPLWIATGVTALAMSLHPNGLFNYGGFWAILTRDVDFSMYGEWMPTTFEDSPVFWCFLLFSVSVYVLHVMQQRQVDLTDLLILLPFGYLALRYNRAVMAYALVALPIVSRQLRDLFEALALKWPSFRSWQTGLALVLTLVLAVASAQLYSFNPDKNFRFGLGLNEAVFPVGSARFVEGAGLQGNMYNMDGFGGYLSYELAPERKIFHYNLPPVFEALPNYVHNPESRAAFDINYAIIGRADELQMFKRDQYVPVYWEPTGMVLLRPSPENRELLQKYRIRFFQPLLPEERLRQMFQQRSIAAQLFREWVVYLSYRSDPALTAVLGELLLTANHGIAQAEIAARLPALQTYNDGQPKLLLAYGVALNRTGQLDKALAQFERVVALDPQEHLARLNAAFIYIDRQDWNNARTQFETVLAAEPDNPFALYGRGLDALQQNQTQAAAEAFQRYLQLQPQGPFATNARTYLQSLQTAR